MHYLFYFQLEQKLNCFENSMKENCAESVRFRNEVFEETSGKIQDCEKLMAKHNSMKTQLDDIVSKLRFRNDKN